MSATRGASHRPVPVTRSEPTGHHHLRELEGLRAIAAVAVLLTHAGFLSGATGREILPGFLARMDIGVAVFFVLSGYLLYRPHARHIVLGARAVDPRSYAIRRAARLLPAWLAVLLGTLVLVPESRSADLDAWVANLLQLQSLRLDWDLPGLAQLWSLSTEVAFYVALPFVAAMAARAARRAGRMRHLAALGGLVVGTWVFRALDGLGALPEGFSWIRTLPATGDWFAVGMLLALVTTDEHLRAPVAAAVRAAPWHLYGMAACVFWVVTTRAAGPYDLTPPTPAQATVKHLGYAVVAGLVVAPSVLGARTMIARVLSSPALTALGTISYGIFLWHLPLMFAVRSALGLEVFAYGFWVTVVLTFAAAVVVSALSWHLLEAPIQAWARRRTRVADPAITSPESGQRDEDQRQGA
ncbi:MAG: acyltransferase family protein [Dermatophilaceae bacterium]